MKAQELHDLIDKMGTDSLKLETYYGDDFDNKALARTVRVLLTELMNAFHEEMRQHERQRKNAEKQRRHRARVRSRLLNCPTPSDYKN